MIKNFTVLIIEDDFRVADINRQYVEKVNGFEIQHSVKSGKETLQFLKEAKCLPDLILLDIYIPDVEHLELYWQIKKTYPEIDIIAVTAAKEVKTVQEMLRGGIFDYIVKPFDDTRFEQTLMRYKDIRTRLETNNELNQEAIDQITGFHYVFNSTHETTPNLPKGIDVLTLNEINELFELTGIEGITATELSNEIGTSRSTARRYLEYLVSTNKIKTKLIYGTVGRPERKYILS